MTFAHPQVGTLHLDREKLAISGTEGLMLVVYHAQHGTESAEKLNLLGSIALPASRPVHDEMRSRDSAWQEPTVAKGDG